MDLPQIIVAVIAGVVAMILLPFVERRATHPVLPPRLFREHTFVLTSVASMCLAAVMFSFFAYMPTFVQFSLQGTPADGGLVMIPMAVGSLLGSTLSGQVVARTGRYS